MGHAERAELEPEAVSEKPRLRWRVACVNPVSSGRDVRSGLPRRARPVRRYEFDFGIVIVTAYTSGDTLYLGSDGLTILTGPAIGARTFGLWKDEVDGTSRLLMTSWRRQDCLCAGLSLLLAERYAGL